jgi:NTE family protein
MTARFDAVEELPRSFFCTSGDLVAGEVFTHRRGKLYRAVGTSMAIPALVKPVPMGDRLLVDGGMLNNLPVDIMSEAGEGPIIAIDVTARFEAPAVRGEDEHEGRRRARRIRRTGRPELLVPTLPETLMRAFLLGSADTSEAARRHADLVITPASEGAGLLEFHQLDVLRESGRRAAWEALERAPAALFA